MKNVITRSITVTKEQSQYLEARREILGFLSFSDVVRDLIRTYMRKENDARICKKMGWKDSKSGSRKRTKDDS